VAEHNTLCGTVPKFVPDTIPLRRARPLKTLQSAKVNIVNKVKVHQCAHDVKAIGVWGTVPWICWGVECSS